MKTIVQLVEEQKEYFLGKDTAAKQAVEANIAPVEADPSSASRAYVVGEQLFLNDVLYDVTSPISVGDAIVVNTNITAANKLSADIKSKIDDLYSKNQTLTNQVTGLLDNTEVNGAVNMLPNTATTPLQPINGITFTVNDDGTITIDGTASATVKLNIYQENAEKWLKQNTAYKATVDNSVFGGISTQDCYVQLFREGSPYPVIAYFNGSAFIVPTSYFNISQRLAVQIVVKEGVTVTNQTIKPMISVASYNGDYVPYAKSNKELTDLWNANKYVEYDISGDTSSLDFTNATRKLLVNTFTRHCMICVQNVITTTAFNVGDAIALGDIPFSSYIPKYNVYGSGRALNGTTLYNKIFFSKNNVNATFAMNCYENIPVGTSINMSIEWSY